MRPGSIVCKIGRYVLLPELKYRLITILIRRIRLRGNSGGNVSGNVGPGSAPRVETHGADLLVATVGRLIPRVCFLTERQISSLDSHQSDLKVAINRPLQSIIYMDYFIVVLRASSPWAVRRRVDRFPIIPFAARSSSIPPGGAFSGSHSAHDRSRDAAREDPMVMMSARHLGFSRRPIGADSQSLPFWLRL
jgi:hypothetical protein